ncbi:NADH-cytochrome b5 reductase 1 [Wickerhamomyces ciferrii]|uniref:NADH-cytochrome b5 reductase 1 n=1 Tax=Wickerhamomyces ciferrii (strain ATCC 14091 / BCRC 22168 / CBS 111 / JCM 3599 / NBRC 0793 / NRRL Y-1031 F-60-10) TaxID=1206466 RepID=K0KFU8_WICCF|nr:NADH-cytochrome b5 reductase 1 [Wickerhamomyces ciferrii]CCH44035.1 NADH-cytochrome b5 reductase 1 [Wickerhamomyces ciferrii]
MIKALSTRFINLKTVSTIIGITSLTSSLYFYNKSTLAIQNDSNQLKPLFPNYIFGTKLKLKEIIQDTHDTKILKFQIPDGYNLGLSPGQPILLSLRDKQTGSLKIKPYSPLIGPEDNQDTLQFAIKLFNENGTSGALHKLEIGDEIKFRGPLPINNFKFKPEEKVNFIAGGCGITPIYSMISKLLEQGQNEIKLIYSSSHANEIILKSKIDELKSKYGDKFHVIYLSNNGYQQDVLKSKINYEFLSQNLFQNSNLIVCGSKGLTTDIKNKYLNKSLNNKLYIL